MRILLIRHAEPDYALDSVTPKGRREALLLADRLVREPVEDYYVSPLGRARDTLRPTLERLGREATVLPWLREFPGRRADPVTGETLHTWDRLPDDWTRFEENLHPERWLSEPTYAAGDVAECARAVTDGLDALLGSYGYVRDGRVYRVERESHATVALVCHFAVGCVILGHLINVSPVALWHGLVALPSSVTTLATEERVRGLAAWRCSSYGDLSHLYAAGEEPSFMARFCETFSDETRH
ncbi:MAG: histidine phosphatase family protein [Eubacteriales bacterium]|nr:histidine phosphatase family protein [Eubacteriales bacterium]